MKELIADHGEAILYVITGILIAGFFTRKEGEIDAGIDKGIWRKYSWSSCRYCSNRAFCVYFFKQKRSPAQYYDILLRVSAVKREGVCTH